MPNQSLENDLQDFVQFATRRIESGTGGESVEQLVEEWRNEAELLTDVRQGVLDKAAGLAEPADRVFADVRGQLGLSE